MGPFIPEVVVESYKYAPGHQKEAVVECLPRFCRRPCHRIHDGLGYGCLTEECIEIVDKQGIELRGCHEEDCRKHDPATDNDSGIIVSLPVFKIPGKEIQQYCCTDQAYIGIHMAYGICREIHAGAFESEEEEPGSCNGKNDGVCNQQVFTGTSAIEIEHELDDGEYTDDEGEQDHGRHNEEAEKIRDTRKDG